MLLIRYVSKLREKRKPTAGLATNPLRNKNF